MNNQTQPCVVVVGGRLDALTAPDQERQLKASVENGAHRLVLDLTTLEYISSAGLRVLLTVLKTLEARGGRLCLAGVGPNVTSVLKMSGLDAVLPKAATVAEALASFDPQ